MSEYITGARADLAPLPPLSDLAGLSNADLMAVLRDYGVHKQWSELVSQTSKYNEWITGLSPTIDRARFEEQMNTLLDMNPRDDGRPPRGLRALARRTEERYTTLEAVGGDVQAELIRISVGDDNVCSGCSELGGEIATYAEHMQNPPGSQECGPNCRCQLIRIEGGAAAEPMGVAT